VGEEPGFRVVNHADKGTHDLVVVLVEVFCAGLVEVAAVNGEFEPALRFSGLGLGVVDLQYEGPRITPLPPCLREVGTNRPGRSSDLIDERLALFAGELLRQIENPHRRTKGSLVTLKLMMMQNPLRHISPPHPFPLSPPQGTAGSIVRIFTF